MVKNTKAVANFDIWWQDNYANMIISNDIRMIAREAWLAALELSINIITENNNIYKSID